MIKINLIGEGRRPTAVRKRRDMGVSLNRENLGNYMLIIGVVLGLLPLLGEWWLFTSRLKDRQQEVVVLEAEYEELKEIIAEVNAFKKKKAELEHKISTIKNLKQNQKGPVQVMDSVSKALPELAWLRRMEVKASQIVLKGQARNENAVAAFIDNLDKTENFKEPSLNQMRETRGGIYNFTITVGYTIKKPADDSAQAAGA